jgi:putative PIN family toxin of toxin-antitoxin system
LNAHVIQTILSEYSGVAKWKEPTEHFNVVPDDISDNQFVDCAIVSKADYLITGDRHLLQLETFRTVKIISVDGFLEVIASGL